MSKVILSGIQPSGQLHIGNYLGALSNFVTLQNSGNYECFFTIVDYHSISEDYDPKKKPGQILDLAANFLAVGLDPKKSTIFIQSHVPEHLELAWIFNAVTPISELERMTQFKDKAARQAANINAALFNYPLLMAADILAYKAAEVPVGIDQKQHLELTNTVVRKFNARFGKTFSEIKPLWTKFPKVLDLKRPDKKMSKSEPQGCIFLDDEEDIIAAKLQKAVTASEGDKKSPGVENLFLLLGHFGAPEQVAHFHESQKNNSLKFSELKAYLASAIANHFKNFREKKKELLAKPDYLAEVLAQGAKKARSTASKTLREVKQKTGLI